MTRPRATFLYQLALFFVGIICCAMLGVDAFQASPSDLNPLLWLAVNLGAHLEGRVQ
jgi:hypothetical protein